jgi:hypothetical protein
MLHDVYRCTYNGMKYTQYDKLQMFKFKEYIIKV